MPILLPHRLMAKMYECYHDSFMDRLLGGDADVINRFWTAMEKHPAYADHRMHTHSRSDHRKFGTPIGMHFDGVVSTGSGRKWARMIESFSWSSHLCKRGASWFRNFLICLVQKIMLVKEGADTTMNCLIQNLTIINFFVSQHSEAWFSNSRQDYYCCHIFIQFLAIIFA